MRGVASGLIPDPAGVAPFHFPYLPMSLPSDLGHHFGLAASIAAGVFERRFCPEPVLLIRSNGTAVVQPQLIRSCGDFAFVGPTVAEVFMDSLAVLQTGIISAASIDVGSGDAWSAVASEPILLPRFGMVHFLRSPVVARPRAIKALLHPASRFLYHPVGGFRSAARGLARHTRRPE